MEGPIYQLLVIINKKKHEKHEKHEKMMKK